jgi:pyruvate-formate lyase-activating enzyme
MNAPPVRAMAYDTLVIPLTHRCNLDCSLCFVPQRGREDLSFEQVCRVIDRFQGTFICLSGGEPTLRDDLKDTIRYINSVGKSPQLFSNGIRLAEPDYVRELADAGLDDVLLSFNGFDDGVYRRVSGRPLLKEKLRALQNLVDEDMRVAISPTIVKGLNETEVPALLRLCLDHPRNVYQLRVRGACRVGKHEGIDHISTSELLRLVADALGGTVDGFLSAFDPGSCFHSVIQFNLLGAFSAEIADPELIAWNSGLYTENATEQEIADDLSRRVAGSLGTEVTSVVTDPRLKLLHIDLWGWPDTLNIDLQEIGSHGVYHLVNNEVPMNFCQAMLRADEL